MRYFIVNNNTVENVIIWDGLCKFQPNGELIPEIPGVDIGWTCDEDGNWHPPELE
jgi:hypothetical protein